MWEEMSREKIRILAIGHSYVVGMNRAILRQIAEDPRFEVSVVAPEFFHGSLRKVQCDDEPEGSQLKVLPIKTYLSASKIHFFFYDPIRLKSVLRREKVDVFHIWEEPYIVSGFQVAHAVRKLSGAKFFLTCQNIKKSYPMPFSIFEKKVLAWTDGWVGLGQEVKKTLLAQGYSERNAQVIGLPADTRAFLPVSEEDKRGKQKTWGLTGPVIGFVGRLTPDKGIPLIMDVFERIADELPWSLYFMGSGPLRNEILRWAEERNWSHRVKVGLVTHDEVPQVMNGFDFIIAPSQTMPHWREQFGRMLVEAFASGVPVIGSDSGEIPYVIGDAGRVVPEKDMAGWETAIRELISDENVRTEMRTRGLERAKAFSAESIAEEYKAYYSHLAAIDSRNNVQEVSS